MKCTKNLCGTLAIVLLGTIILQNDTLAQCGPIPSADVLGLRDAYQLAQDKRSRDHWIPRYNPIKGGGTCVGAAFDLHSDLARLPGLTGWRISVIHNSFHTANLLSSPSGRHYFLENNIDLLLFEMEQFEDEGKTQWRPCPGVEFSFRPLAYRDKTWERFGLDTNVPPGKKELVPSRKDISVSADSTLVPCYVPTPRSTFPINPVGSIDPNDKIGSMGTGNEKYISGKEPLRYVIYFENLASATAPAQKVVINDILETDKFEFESLSIGAITIGRDNVIVPPPGQIEYSSDIDLRPENDLILRIQASLNTNTGLLQWTFLSIDPFTGELTEDPLAGFLPPNTNPPEGEGSVLFTIMPKVDMGTGSSVRNRASIFFDQNDPIETPIWINTIDNTEPVSRVLTATDRVDSTSYTLQWEGSDEGSGIVNYSVYVARSEEPFRPWIINTTETSAIFEADSVDVYHFFSIARDGTGNIEAAKNTSDLILPVGIDLEEKGLSKQFELHQNFPNPFKSSTNIEFEIVEPTHVRLVVYDIIGREVDILIDERMTEGQHNLQWIPQGLSSGVYFYRITTEDFTKVRTLILTK